MQKIGFYELGLFGAVLGCFWDPSGGIWGCPGSVSLYPVAPLPLRRFITKYEPSISKTLGFMD